MVGPPSRGVLAGIKNDAQKAKETGGTYDPNSVGTAWSHNFLNQKPWHPSNFRNQARVFDAEQQAVRDAKARADAKVELMAAQAQLEAEHEQLKTISYLSAEEQAKYAERQSIAFMYMKPPGLDAAMSKAAEGNKAEQRGQEQAGPSGPPREHRRGPPGPEGDESRSSVGNMLGAMAALQQNDKWELSHMSSGMRQSPPRGGAGGGENQVFVMDDQGGEAAAPPPLSAGDAKRAKRELKRQKVEEAKAILRQHGLDVPGESDSGSSDSEHERHHKGKKSKKRKHKSKKSKSKT